MYEGDRSRKSVLVDYGFRLPSAMDNRPLNFSEFMGMTNQIVYVSATPAEFELKNSIVGNAAYFPHKRDRIGEEEAEPFAVAGEPDIARRLLPARPGLRISRIDLPAEEFDVTHRRARGWSSSKSSVPPACSTRASPSAR